MLKKRIIASLILKNNTLVQSIVFKRYLPIGSLKASVENLNRFGVDEIVVVDIDASKENRIINPSLIQEAAKVSFVPITVAGGIKTTEDIKLLLNSGADKIMLNTVFWDNESFIQEASHIFGKQCIIVSFDTFNDRCYDYIGKKMRDEKLLDSVLKAQKLGAGEVLINNVQNDGMKQGMDIEFIHNIVKQISIPLIAQGGVGDAKHIQEALDIDALSAVAVGNFFHFTEHSVNISKGYIKSKKNYPIRNETYANYIQHRFDKDTRVAKIDDEKLSHMWFEQHPKEEI